MAGGRSRVGWNGHSRLRVERYRRRWTLNDVAGRSSIAASDLSQLERGLRPAYRGWRRRLSRVFRLPQRALFPEIHT